jgi:hypothetical protein
MKNYNRFHLNSGSLIFQISRGLLPRRYGDPVGMEKLSIHTSCNRGLVNPAQRFILILAGLGVEETPSCQPIFAIFRICGFY